MTHKLSRLPFWRHWLFLLLSLVLSYTVLPADHQLSFDTKQLCLPLLTQLRASSLLSHTCSYHWNWWTTNVRTRTVKRVFIWSENRGYYTVARRYEFYVRVARIISHEWAQRTSEILFLPREHKIHIFEPTCNVLFIIWRNQFNKSKKRESWRHWTRRHSRRWHTENTPLGSRMKWRMESTSGLVPSKTLSSI